MLTVKQKMAVLVGKHLKLDTVNVNDLSIEGELISTKFPNIITYTINFNLNVSNSTRIEDFGCSMNLTEECNYTFTVTQTDNSLTLII